MKICLIMRPVPAPSAIWMANSLLGADDRARDNPATFAAAMSSTSTTSTIRTSSGLRSGPAANSVSGLA